MSGISLSAGVRQNLLSLQQTSDLLATTQNRLATGKKVNSALDNANEYFTSQSLTNRANSLSSLLDGITNGVNTIQAANNGISAITKLVQSAQSLVTQAQQTTDTNVQASLATQYGAILTQIDQLAGDSGFNGTNLLGGGSLTLTLNETGTSTATVAGVTDTSTGLSIAAASSAWAGATDIAAASTDLTAALTTLADAIGDTQLELVDDSDPLGLHQGDDQHPADGFRLAHGRQTATRKAPTCWRSRLASRCPPRPCRCPLSPTRTCSSCSAANPPTLSTKVTTAGPKPRRRFFNSPLTQCRNHAA